MVISSRLVLVGMPLVLCFGIVAAAPAALGTGEQAPNAAQIAEMLKQRPISRENWIHWRSKHLEWLFDRSGLTKVATDGQLFEASMYKHADDLLGEGKAFVNLYESFRQFRDEGMPKEERDALYQRILDEQGSLFSTHPTFRQRVDAIALMPDVPQKETASARELFEDPEALEKELTDYFTGYLQYLQFLQQAATQES